MVKTPSRACVVAVDDPEFALHKHVPASRAVAVSREKPRGTSEQRLKVCGFAEHTRLELGQLACRALEVKTRSHALMFPRTARSRVEAGIGNAIPFAAQDGHSVVCRD